MIHPQQKRPLVTAPVSKNQCLFVCFSGFVNVLFVCLFQVVYPCFLIIVVVFFLRCFQETCRTKEVQSRPIGAADALLKTLIGYCCLKLHPTAGYHNNEKKTAGLPVTGSFQNKTLSEGRSQCWALNEPIKFEYLKSRCSALSLSPSFSHSLFLTPPPSLWVTEVKGHGANGCGSNQLL